MAFSPYLEVAMVAAYPRQKASKRAGKAPVHLNSFSIMVTLLLRYAEHLLTLAYCKERARDPTSGGFSINFCWATGWNQTEKRMEMSVGQGRQKCWRPAP
jgi:hypothetical protein